MFTYMHTVLKNIIKTIACVTMICFVRVYFDMIHNTYYFFFLAKNVKLLNL